MMYPFLTLDDDTEIVHSELREEATLKKVYMTSGTILLIPENPNYDTMTFEKKNERSQNPRKIHWSYQNFRLTGGLYEKTNDYIIYLIRSADLRCAYWMWRCIW